MINIRKKNYKQNKIFLSEVIQKPSILFEDEQYRIMVDDDILKESKRIVG